MSPQGPTTPAGDRFAVVPGVPSAKGVALNAPPASILGRATELVRDAMAQVPADERGTLVALATRQGDVTHVNLALATKVGSRVEVVTWIGKSWGEPVAAAPLTAGGAVRVHF